MTQNIYDDPAFFDAYAKLGRSVHGLDGAPEWASLEHMLPALREARIADLGCGYGWFCRYARQHGAASVLGIDVSQKMLAKAQEMTHDASIAYECADMETLRLPEAAFDLVYSSLAFHYIRNLASLWQTVYRALDVGGQFIFSVEHPIYTASASPGWMTDGKGNKAWPVNNYQKEGQRVTDWLAEGVVKQHRTVGTYLNSLISCGFTIAYVEEWGPTPQQIADCPALDEEKERPMLLLVSARK